VASLFDRSVPREPDTFVVDAVFNGKLPIALGGGSRLGGRRAIPQARLRPGIGSKFYDANVTPCPVQASPTAPSRPAPTSSWARTSR
jgi:hypothetical protein